MNQYSASIYTQDPGKKSFRVLGLDLGLQKRIIHLGLPVIIGMLSQTAINTVDLIFIGRLDAHIAVPGAAAIFFSIILLWLFGGFLAAISVGTQAISARRFSEGNFFAAGRVLTNSLAVAVASSVIMYFLLRPFAHDLVALLTSDPDIREIGGSYVGIRFLGLTAMATTAAYKSFYDGLGKVRVHMTVAICMNLMNIILCYLLIFGFSFMGFTLPPQNIDGAAIAAIISSYFGLFLMVAWSFRREDRKSYKVYSLSNLDRKVAWSVVSLSIWSGLATIVLMAGVGLFFKIIGQLDQLEGLKAINSSAASIIINIMMLVFMTCLAFGTATATLVSQSVGAKKFDLASKYAWQSVLLALYAVGVFGVLLHLFPESFLRLFMPHELASTSETLKDVVVAHALPSMKWIIPWLCILSAAALILTQALYGAGKTKFVLIAEFFLHFGVMVPLAYVLSITFGFGLMGCWLAGLAYGVGLFLATGIMFAKGNWKDTVL